jgi:type I restriction enzyme R subunit
VPASGGARLARRARAIKPRKERFGKLKSRARCPRTVRTGNCSSAFAERQTTTKQTLRQLEEVVREYRQTEQAQQATDLSPEGFAVFWLLDRQKITKVQVVAQAAEDAFRQFPRWQRSAEYEREVRKVLYKALLDAGVERVVEGAERVLTMLRREAV